MEKTMTMKNEKIRAKFLKDTKIPIPLVESPYFEYFLEEFDKQFDVKRKYKDYLKQLETYETFDEYKVAYCELTDEVIERVKNKDSYKKFLEDKFFLNLDIPKVQKPMKTIYKENLANRYYLSMDLKQANFYAFKNYDADIVDNCENYEEWILTFKNGEKFKDSKAIRQVIFGNLNPKRQQTYQKYFMMNFINHMLTQGFFKEEDGEEKPIIVAGSDELLVDVTDLKESGKLVSELEKVKQAVESYLKDFKFELKLEVFKLEKNLGGESTGYTKRFEDSTYELKGVSKLFYPQVMKHMEGKEVHEYDLYFMNTENILSKMLKPLY